MSSPDPLERRLDALEARLTDFESRLAESLRGIRRDMVRTQLNVEKIVQYLGIDGASDTLRRQRKCV